MTAIRQAYLLAARSAVTLLREPALAERWTQPSVLPEFSVHGLAGHLASQVLNVPRALAQDIPDEPPIRLLTHYARSTWRGAEPDAEINVMIRRAGEDIATDGAAALASRTETVTEELATRFETEPANRVVHFRPGPWPLYLDDFLRTRMLEIAVHSDDLASSMGIDTPDLPDKVLAPVLNVLTKLAVRQHGQAAVLRTLSRAERAPDSIAAL
ncbi:mycothiol maleylpyruvate isomerase-like protein [Tamaricihabitans halophyticus]|uniref:Mycothiol maleylpyruvate isomerase-like protein n=1 Tax=Tamaricihabitans halophyticus TaxID=1262583 RepID=A0A4R2RCZ8_9PSEU|nr:maleylpyruvate isomerase N-terminal domain-containing protein [Tamaricihabitans halophyticus]TCP57295.1 mycothiol maleylpyruvate isomerase-like protein [Tamaricihabitans halophyticus]